MSNVCVSWSLEDLVAMTDKDMDGLLKYYQSGEVPSLHDIRGASS
jgi:precorrin-2 dehydrogenase/sirohydrochlorin ferrochelatase